MAAMDDRLEHIVLVDENDREVGTVPKLDGHRRGLLHRALSVIVRDPAGRLLLQKRHVAKYHSGGLWTNTCCSHPRPDEPVIEAAGRRLQEEMGITCPLLPLITVTYRADVGNGLIEHELVHVFAGRYEGAVRPHPLEADGYDWNTPEDLQAGLAAAPARFSVWFRKYCAEHWELIGGGEAAGATCRGWGRE
ncbi:MAG: isopentenyl-diphosphate Delta-isomerase [Geminicoccaceae bacterium]